MKLQGKSAIITGARAASAMDVSSEEIVHPIEEFPFAESTWPTHS